MSCLDLLFPDLVGRVTSFTEAVTEVCCGDTAISVLALTRWLDKSLKEQDLCLIDSALMWKHHSPPCGLHYL